MAYPMPLPRRGDAIPLARGLLLALVRSISSRIMARIGSNTAVSCCCTVLIIGRFVMFIYNFTIYKLLFIYNLTIGALRMTSYCLHDAKSRFSADVV